MDSFLGIGLPELIVVLILAGLVMGPHRIREVARTLGKVTAQLQAVSREFVRQLNAELDSLDDGQMKGTMQDFRKLQEEVESLRRELRQAPKSLARETKEAVREAETVLKDDSAGDTEGGEEPGPVVSASDDGTPLPKLIEVADDPD